MKWIVGIIAALLLVGCGARAANDDPSQIEILQDQTMLQYNYKEIIAAADDLCTHGDKTSPFGYNPVALYKARVKNYNEGQQRLKDLGYGGPAEYPEKIPDYSKSDFTDWCGVKEKVTGLSCADDV